MRILITILSFFGSIFLLSFGLETLIGIEDLLTKSDALGSYLAKLIVLDKFETLFKAEIKRRRKAHSVVASGSTHVGNMLLLTNVYRDIIGLRINADDHTFVNFRAGTYEKVSSVLSIEESVGHRRTALERYEDAV